MAWRLRAIHAARITRAPNAASSDMARSGIVHANWLWVDDHTTQDNLVGVMIARNSRAERPSNSP